MVLASVAGLVWWYVQPTANVSSVVDQENTSTTSPNGQSTATSSAKTSFNIYLVALEDNGLSGKKIGCNDSLIPVRQEVAYTPAVLKTALEQLLKLKSTTYGESGLYNALAASRVTIDEVSIENGKATVRLSGQLVSGGVCEDPRIIAQIEETVRQFPTVTSADIFINNQTLAEYFSLR